MVPQMVTEQSLSFNNPLFIVIPTRINPKLWKNIRNISDLISDLKYQKFNLITSLTISKRVKKKKKWVFFTSGWYKIQVTWEAKEKKIIISQYLTVSGCELKVRQLWQLQHHTSISPYLLTVIESLKGLGWKGL